MIDNFSDSKIVLTDIDTDYINQLKVNYVQPNVSVFKLDLANEQDFLNLNINFDSVMALNVLEHVKDDVQALNNVYNALNPGGRFIVLVPAHNFLYNCIDKSIGHFRRYNKKKIINKISKTDFKIKKMFYFNFLAILGWYWTGNIQKRNIIQENSIDFFNKLVPFLNYFETHLLRKKLGISLVAILEKD